MKLAQYNENKSQHKKINTTQQDRQNTLKLAQHNENKLQLVLSKVLTAKVNFLLFERCLSRFLNHAEALGVFESHVY